jgi:hypothetical protein
MLDFLRSVPSAVGINLKGEQADTSWLFCLPSLELTRTLVLGSISPATLSALACLSDELGAADAGAKRRPRAGAGEARAALLDEQPIPRLIHLDSGNARELAGDSAAVARLEAVLESGGAIYVAPSGAVQAAASLRARLNITETVRLGFGVSPPAAPRPQAARTAWMIPESAAVAVGLQRQRARLRRLTERATSVALRRGAKARVGPVSEPDTALRIVDAHPGQKADDGALASHGVLLRTGSEQLPEYVRETAAHAGIELDPQRWSLAPPRGYRSQKVIFFTRTLDGTPCVVKLTQDPRYNRLLDNEARSLTALETLSDPAFALPRPLFEGAHAGLATIGQSALSGRAFTSVSDGSPSCPTVGATVDAVTALALRTAARGEAGAVGEALTDLLGRYVSIYAPAATERRFIERCVERLDRVSAALPVVFLHADTTVFNLLVTESGAVGLVDWENAEPRGMPLWDLLHFLQTYGVWSAQRSGARYSAATFRRQLLGESDFSGLLRRATRAYGEALALPDDSLEPLFHTCWMQQAVRQARQLRAADLGRGLYHRLLRSSIAASRRGSFRL